MFTSVDEVAQRLADVGYLTDRRIATTVFLQSRLDKPVLLEGPAGVGKTELAKAVAAASGRRLLRLQCYEGQDDTKALYEWDYGKQLLYTQMLRDKIGEVVADAPDLASAVEKIGSQDSAFFSERFLAPRPLLEAVRSPEPVVLLIDEVDRADEALEAVLLEMLAENQVSVPELGTYTATRPPYVVLTSNNTRDLSAALKRRCLHLFLDYPSAARELEILHSKDTGLAEAVAVQLVDVVRGLRELELRKPPSISETIDWARTLAVLGVSELSAGVLADTVSVVAKYDKDVSRALDALPRLVDPNAEVPDEHGHGHEHGHEHGHGHGHGHGHHSHGGEHGHGAGGSGDNGTVHAAAVRAAADDEGPDGRRVRADRDEPGRHGPGVYGNPPTAEGSRDERPAPPRPVSSSQGSRSFLGNRSRGKGRDR